MGGFFSVEQGPFNNGLPGTNMMNNSSIKNANRVNGSNGSNGSNGAKAPRTNNAGNNLEKGPNAPANQNAIEVVVNKNNGAKANRISAAGPNVEKGEGAANVNTGKINVVVNSNNRRNNRRNNKNRNTSSPVSAAAPLSPSGAANVEKGLSSNQASDPGFSPNSPVAQAGGKRHSRKGSKGRGSRRAHSRSAHRRNTRK